MNKSTRSFKGHWPLDYGWSRRGGRWGDFTDVMLIASSGGDACCAAALSAWFALHEQDSAQLDGRPCVIAYTGGVQAHLGEWAPDSEVASPALFLHSRGQDAFDSLAHTSQEIADFARARGCANGLTWHEARHDRRDHQLQWP